MVHFTDRMPDVPLSPFCLLYFSLFPFTVEVSTISACKKERFYTETWYMLQHDWLFH